ncbi:MAG: putative ATPase related to the helicase subunit of the Holliday junction resolvase [Candidatus Krumholzibacteriota bacterium]|nr:putative ATPase related to the helicase subunit of the Holliday junction resolvase [Candidatus Krumholzibacteriota bacterium]
MDVLFPPTGDRSTPLSDRMRPRTLDEFVGQEEIIGPGTLLRKALDRGTLTQSLILWGPPGSGKTTLARIIAAMTNARFVTFSAVTSGIAEVKRTIAEARKLKAADGRPLLLFIDEIHRFNKAQQDAFLPHVEDGTIVLLGATTENPSFEVIGPLLSRARVIVLKELAPDLIAGILKRALADAERGLGNLGIRADDEVLTYIADVAHGDARVALNALDYAASVLSRTQGERVLTRKIAEDALQKPMLTTDKAGESHYNLISALHKSLRGGDVDASLYWLARMCEAGEDPLFIARRLVVFASEDVGNADPHALPLVVAAKDAVNFLGYPECTLPLAQAVAYLALAPKSNASYLAYQKAAETANEKPPYPVPLQIRNAPTRLMKGLGYGRGYKYPHDYEDAFVVQDYLPEALKDFRFYLPKDSGFEKELAERLNAYLARRRAGVEKGDSQGKKPR